MSFVSTILEIAGLSDGWTGGRDGQMGNWSWNSQMCETSWKSLHKKSWAKLGRTATAVVKIHHKASHQKTCYLAKHTQRLLYFGDISVLLNLQWYVNKGILDINVGPSNCTVLPWWCSVPPQKEPCEYRRWTDGSPQHLVCQHFPGLGRRESSKTLLTASQGQPSQKKLEGKRAMKK